MLIKAWIEEIKTLEGKRFRVVEESILQPGCRNVVHNNWVHKSNAMKYIADNERKYISGECSLKKRTYASS